MPHWIACSSNATLPPSRTTRTLQILPAEVAALVCGAQGGTAGPELEHFGIPGNNRRVGGGLDQGARRSIVRPLSVCLSASFLLTILGAHVHFVCASRYTRTQVSDGTSGRCGRLGKGAASAVAGGAVGPQVIPRVRPAAGSAGARQQQVCRQLVRLAPPPTT